MVTQVQRSAPPKLGRFSLIRQIGQGAQASVWLAHDPRLDREVALKVLRTGFDAARISESLHEARAVARLTHPNLVPVFEADEHEGRAYMVFEYVHGGTLMERLRGEARMPARSAVELMIGVLDGLQAAHQAGVVHRDLKPSNIMIDGAGRPRIMDFGIAARLTDPSKPERIVGTPGYISPEAARCATPTPQMDVFAAAIILAEMLSGQRLNADADPWRAVRRAAEQDLSLPEDLGADVDDTLRALVQRGLARDVQQRWHSAQAFKDALLEWLHPEHQVEGEGEESATLEFLLRRMRHKSDFPAMSDAVVRVQRLTQSDTESMATLSNEILKDVALTNKLLRMVNSVQFVHAGGGTISTVSRAVSLIGFAGIRNLALSLILLERMENKAHAQRLKEEFLRSLLAGSMARELCLVHKETEESFLAAMFQNLGRLLSEFYFPEEAQQVRRITRPDRSGSKAAPMSEAAASAQVLGISYEQLGLGIAKRWGLPDSLQRCMLLPRGDPPLKQVDDGAERMRWLSCAANEVTEVILHTQPSAAHAKVQQVAARFARALGVHPSAFDAAASQARERLTALVQAMDIHLPKHSDAQRLLAPVMPPPDDLMAGVELQATLIDEPTLVLNASEMTREQSAEILAAGIQDITNVLVDTFKLNEVVRMILEIIYRGLGFRRVVFCLRDPKTESLTGRFGLGDGVETVVPSFRVPLRTPAGSSVDLFSIVCQKGVDTLIADASDSKIAGRLPSWFKGEVAAASFLILPVMMKGSAFAMIYADKTRPNSIDVGEKELSMLRTLRNQAVMAFKQHH